MERPRDVTDTSPIGGRRTSKETRPIRVRDHHKLSRAARLASSRTAASPAADRNVMRAWRFICHCRSSSRARRAARHDVPHRKRIYELYRLRNVTNCVGPLYTGCLLHEKAWNFQGFLLYLEIIRELSWNFIENFLKNFL